MEKDHSELVTQLEYYFSDKNLEWDEFFYNEIEGNAEGFLAFDILMNCNKIKKMGCSREDMAAATEASTLLELNEAKDSIRRIDRKLPEFLGTRKAAAHTRSQRKNSGVEHEVRDEEHDKEDEEKEKKFWFAPVLLVIPEVEGLPKNGKLIEETIGGQYGCVIPYARVNKTDGHVVVDGNDVPEDFMEKALKDGFEFEGKKFHLRNSDARQLKQFSKESMGFLEKIVKKKFGKQVKKNSMTASKKLFSAFTFGGRRFSNFSNLQTEFKNIISKTKNGAEVEESAAAMLRELLTHHEKGSEKSQDVKGFTVNFHPTYKQTRCFFVIKEDGSHIDFSLHKCLNNLKEKLLNE